MSTTGGTRIICSTKREKNKGRPHKQARMMEISDGEVMPTIILIGM